MWPSKTSLRLAAVLVIGAVAVSGLFFGASFLSGPANSPSLASARPSPSATSSPVSDLTPGFSGEMPTAKPPQMALPSPVITGAVRFDATSGLVFLSDRMTEYLRTTKDGGSTWSDLRRMPSGGAKLAADFVDVEHGWRAYDIADGTLKLGRTNDGGRTWTEVSLAFPAGNRAPSSPYINGAIQFRDQSNGVLLISYIEGGNVESDAEWWPPYFCGEFTTSDGGATWSAPKAGRCLLQPAFASDLVGYAGILDETWGSPSPPAKMAITMDGGQTWTDAKLPGDWVEYGWSPQILFMQRRSDGTLRALCGCGPPPPTMEFGLRPSVISSNDGGRTWSFMGTSYGFAGYGGWVGATGEDRWLSNNTVLSKLEVSEDGGLRWRALQPSGLLDTDPAATISTWSNGWLVTTTLVWPTFSSLDSYVASGRLYATDDGGITVRPISVP